MVVEEGMFDYETDGLIFTPCDKSVGSDKTGVVIPPRKVTLELFYEMETTRI